jgi:O-acetyl-ADP-ribose deacetylase (regulator of RNase III)
VADEIVVNKTKVKLVQGDITQQSTEAIVNAANSSLMGGGGVDGAIHRGGGSTILEECRKIIARIGRLDTGKAMITGAGNLQAKYVIHTVGPIWHGGGKGEAGLLESSYRECMKLATAYKLKSLSFPSISTGAYRYPITEAADIALNTVIEYLTESPSPLKEIFYVLYDSQSHQIYSKKISEIISNN